MVSRLASTLSRWVEVGLWLAFAALIITVGLQVFARNVLRVPLIWTLDVAQLLFSWLIFVGAAIAYRKGAHYTVDVIPARWRSAGIALEVVGVLAALLVIYVLVVPGWTNVLIRSTGSISSLDISLMWTVLPLPISGLLMLVFLIERVVDRLAKRDT